MGVLLELATNRRITPGSRCVLGRHAGCDVRVDDPRVSGEHAGVYWRGDSWELRDLGSRNGTIHMGKRLDAGARVALSAGETFGLGSLEQAFRLEDAAPPSAAARRVSSGAVRVEADGLLVLPDDERPLVSVFLGPEGRWVIESEAGAHPAADREVVVVDGEAWALDLPEILRATWAAGDAAPTLETISLRLRVSRDEEHVEATVLHGARALPLPPRTYHYLLVVLARARLADRAAPAAERGWIDRAALCKMLATDDNKLNVDIFRARKQLGEIGVIGAPDLIERRRGTGQVRLGTDRVEVAPL